MKRYYCGVIFLFMMLFIGGIFISILQAAEIIHVKGKVEVQSAGANLWKVAQIGMKLNVGDSIRTARRSEAEILLDREKMDYIGVQESTLLILNSKTPGQIDKFDLSNGKIYAKVEEVKQGLTFEVKTPSAIVGVRGTAFGVESEKNLDTAAAFEKSIFVQAFDKNGNLISEIMVPENFKTLIERFEAPGALIELSSGELNEWNEFREDSSQRVEEALTRREEGGEGREEKTLEQTEEENQQLIEEITQTQELSSQESTEVKDLIEETGTEEDIEDLRGGHGEPS